MATIGRKATVVFDFSSDITTAEADSSVGELQVLATISTKKVNLVHLLLEAFFVCGARTFASLMRTRPLQSPKSVALMS